MPRKNTKEEVIRRAILDIKETIGGIDYLFLSREYDNIPKKCLILKTQTERLCSMSMSSDSFLRYIGIVK